MEIKTIITVIIAGMLGTVVFVGLLPVFAETSSATDTFTNEGYYDMTYDERDNVTVKWEYATPYQLTVNDEVVPIDQSNFSSSNRRTIFIGDDFVLRTNISWSGGVSYPLVQFTTPTGDSIFAGAVPGSENNLTIECVNGAYTVYKDSTSVKTGSYTYIYTVSNDGEFVMKKSDTPAYLNGDSEFIAMGTSTIDGQDTGIKIIGTIDDGPTISVWRGLEWTFSNEQINATEVNNYLNLYSLSSITADAVSGDYSGSITYTYFLVPSEVTAEKSIHPDGPTTALLNLLPVLIAIGLILGIAGAIFIKRM